MLTTILKSFDTFVIIATTSKSITLSLTRIGLLVRPVSTGIPRGLKISNNVKYEIVIWEKNKYKKQYDQTNESFDNLYRLSLRENLFDEN